MCFGPISLSLQQIQTILSRMIRDSDAGSTFLTGEICSDAYWPRKKTRQQNSINLISGKGGTHSMR